MLLNNKTRQRIFLCGAREGGAELVRDDRLGKQSASGGSLFSRGDATGSAH
jgi:hypothetical protein